MKILLAGSTGYVGSIIRQHLDPNYDLFCTSTRCPSGGKQAPCDLTDRDAVFRLADMTRPDVVIHAAGNKNIAYCEKNPDQAFCINCDSVKNVAAAFGNARIIYISSDYVFDGQRGGYREDDLPAPATAYGRSKLCGETAGMQIENNNFVVLRASALYDENSTFVRFLREKLDRKEPVECFADTVYSPTYYRDFLDILVKLSSHPVKGEIFHACGEATSRYEFALVYAKTHNYDKALIKKSSILNQETFLFPDLSLKNDATRRILNSRTTSIAEALAEMKRGGIS